MTKKKERIIKVKKKIVKKWEIWNKEEEVAKSEEKARKLVSPRFYKLKKGFIPRKRNIYSLSREERGEVYKFIKEEIC